MDLSTIKNDFVSVSHIPQNANNCSTSGMDIHAIRRRNLLYLKGNLSTAALAEIIETSDAYLSQIFSPNMRGEIGTRLARRIEKKFDREHGWMDREHRQELSANARRVAEALDLQQLSPQVLEKLANYLVTQIATLRDVWGDDRRDAPTADYPGDRRLQMPRKHRKGDTIGFRKVDDPGPPTPKSPPKPSPPNGAGKRKK